MAYWEIEGLEEWLRAQYDADEKRVLAEEHYSPDEGGYYSCPATRSAPTGDLTFGEGACDCGLARRKATALADLAVKRRIMAMMNSDTAEFYDPYYWAAEYAVRLLASALSDRDGYNPAWAPEGDA
jgi:hypothetical protein